MFRIADVFINSISITGTNDRPTESVSFNFTKLEVKYTSVDWGVESDGRARTLAYGMAREELCL